MGKTKDLFKKIRDAKGTFHANVGSIKDRNGMDLTEAEDIKKRWQEYTEKLYKKDLHDPDNHDGEITHLEPDILEYEVKWTLKSITTNKASGSDGIQSSPRDPVSNLDWRFVSYMILHMFQCHSPKSSHPLPLPLSPKDCSIHLCLFCCLSYRVIITIFLNSIYMC